MSILYVISPLTKEIFKYNYSDQNLVSTLISQLKDDQRPYELIYFSQDGTFSVKPDEKLVDLFPRRQSQVLLLAYSEPRSLPSLKISSNHILVLILTPNLDQIIPYYATNQTNIKEITDFIEEKYRLRIKIKKYQNNVEEELSNQNISQLLPLRNEQIVFIISDLEYVMRKDIPEWVSIPNIFVIVYDWGSTTPETFEHRVEGISGDRITKEDLYFNAIARGIDMDLPLEEIKKQFLADYPNIEWQEDNILRFSDLSQEEKTMVSNYKSYAFKSINDYYRSAKVIDPNHSYFLIQEAIEQMPPLDKEITVFRYVHRTDFLPTEIGNVVELKGYLSTTFDGAFMSKALCPKKRGQKKHVKVMIIKVPRGKKAIFVPSEETELIFPLNTTLRLDDYQSQGQFPCKGNYDDTYYMHTLPVFKYTML